mmetsp:Transcript_31532/g.27921  ORF Transcript_31532/g.27921 Transcript_31532/m.27921 type:complete len:133 (-) Transcript_31532:447-845(-)
MFIAINLTGVLNEKSKIDDEIHQRLIENIDDRETTDEEIIKTKLDLAFILSLPTVKFGCVSILLSNIVIGFLDPIFILKMLDMGIYADKAGYIYVFLQVSYSLFGFCGGILQEMATKKTLIVSGYLAGFVGF